MHIVLNTVVLLCNMQPKHRPYCGMVVYLYVGNLTKCVLLVDVKTWASDVVSRNNYKFIFSLSHYPPFSVSPPYPSPLLSLSKSLLLFSSSLPLYLLPPSLILQSSKIFTSLQTCIMNMYMWTDSSLQNVFDNQGQLIACVQWGEGARVRTICQPLLSKRRAPKETRVSHDSFITIYLYWI